MYEVPNADVNTETGTSVTSDGDLIVADGARGSISGHNAQESVDIQEDRVVEATAANNHNTASANTENKEKGSGGGGFLSKISGLLGNNVIVALGCLAAALLMAIWYSKTQAAYRKRQEQGGVAATPATPATPVASDRLINPNTPTRPVTPVPGGGSML
jgi:hypothetical protein